MRFVISTIFALLLTGCNVVIIPVPVDMPVDMPAPAVTLSPAPLLPTPTPTPDPVALFLARYEAMEALYNALAAQLETFAFDSPEWRGETIRLAQRWRAAIETLQETPQPAGANWSAAWPVLQEALGEYLYVAGAVESAATANDPTLLGTARGRLVDGVNLMYEAMRLLEE